MFLSSPQPQRRLKQHGIVKFLLLVFLAWVPSILMPTLAFSPSSHVSSRVRHASWSGAKIVQAPKRRGVALQLSANQFDVSKPVFDLLSARTVRGDAIVRYDSLNQSEPLRINLYGLLTLVLLAAPSLAEALGGDEMGLVGTAGSIVGSVASLGLFVRECRRRSQQLTRIEKELNAEYLEVRLPTNALADMPFTKAVSLKALKQLASPPRILALCGTASQLQEAIKSLCVLGRRLQQASTFVVAVPTDGSTRSDWNLGSTKSLQWLAEPSDLPSWRTYFDELSSGESTTEFRWFGLNSSGRSFGSGAGDVPQWLEVLGQHLRPTELLDVDDKQSPSTSDEGKKVLEAQSSFYQALTTGNMEEMKKIYSKDASELVSEVIASGGRIDDWNACLADGARPEGMAISGSDALVVSDKEAYSTVIEFPVNVGMETATLLAIQKWGRSSASDEWKLELHQTIPWSPDSKAQGTLRCDRRGCVALTRAQERRTFGGLIG